MRRRAERARRVNQVPRDPGERLPAYIDNSPIQLMLERLSSAVRRVSFAGGEVREIRFDGMKAVIVLEAAPNTPHQVYQVREIEGGFVGYNLERDLRVIWRKPAAKS